MDITDAQSEAIQSLLDKVSRDSGETGIAVAVRVGGDVYYFSAGYANRTASLLVDSDTLFELASVSKSFTAFGILLLAEQGYLSMDDSIQKYLPWFTLRYKGEPVDLSKVTLNHFLHHSSGLVNFSHFNMLPEGVGADMLMKTVETFVNAELAFSPGERYEYGTMNYDVLGLVIAEVSGQSYESFMQTQVLNPLGLNDTYVYEDEAQLTGKLAQGYVSSYSLAFPIEAPKYEGNKPAGYIISCAKDMLRWADIQMGLIDDIPEICKRVVEKSHQADISVPDHFGLYYAAGWEVNTEGTYIGHGGNNPNFSADVKIYPVEQITVVLLANSNQTNNMIPPTLTDSLKGILDGELNQRYMPGLFLLLDRITTGITIAGVILTTLFILLGIRRWKKRSLKPISKKRVVLIVTWLLITIVALSVAIILPAQMWGGSFITAIELRFYSVITGLFALALTCGATTWFVFARRK
ncbi:MAG: beta-lactamase family protein [Coriobacteriales bacterium]|nr:beta-lactamase family protein [Coriobacteriales bacterium]